MQTEAQKLTKTLMYLKAFAAYNMVFLHGMAMIMMSHPSLVGEPGIYQYTYPFRAILSLCQPVFAGFFLRGQVGPYLRQNRIPFAFVGRGFRYLQAAFVLEALRLAFWSLSWSIVFFWNALHFMALSCIVTYAILAMDRRLLPPVFALICLLKNRVDRVMSGNFFLASDIHGAFAVRVAWLWSGALGVLVAGTFYAILKRTVWGRALGNVLAMIVSATVGGFCMLFAHKGAENNADALFSFANIPFSMWSSSSKDFNYWPFFTFYPVFLFGYFLREVLFDSRKRRYLYALSALAVAMAGKALFLDFQSYQQMMPSLTHFDKSVGNMSLEYVIGMLAIFHCSFIAFYFCFRNSNSALLDRWAFLSRNGVFLYIIHPLFFALELRLLPVDTLLAWLGSKVVLDHLYGLSINLIYILSLYASSFVTSIVEGAALI